MARFLLVMVLLSLTGSPTWGTDSVPVKFETQIQPILAAKCGQCHGEKKRQAELSLASASDLVRGGESGPVIVAGKPEESPLYEKILAGEMPPKDNVRP